MIELITLRSKVRRVLAFLQFTVALTLSTASFAAEVMPASPARYFNDYANVVSAPVADRLNRQLEDFEKATSSQVVVVVFPTMQSPSSIEDYVHRMFASWAVGQRERKNGVLLAVFINDRRMHIEVGYGLEGALPDAVARRIIDNEMGPHFKRGDYAAGLSAGVNAILAATRGEYKATGASRSRPHGPVEWFFRYLIFNSLFPWHLFGAFILFSFIFRRQSNRGTVYGGGGRRRYDSGWGWFGGGWGGGGGGSWGGGGGGGGGFSGGGFSGGGGSSGGGGASGGW